MLSGVPAIPRLLGLIALLPFLWGAATDLNADLAGWGAARLGPRFVGPYVQLFFGSVLLSFFSGALFAFASKGGGTVGAIAYVLAALPAVWAFAMTGGGPVSAGMNLIFGFAGLLVLDLVFAYWRLAPAWWVRLRLPMAAVILVCLALGVVL